MPDCRAAGPIGGGLRKLIREFAAATPGQVKAAPVQDFLVGVSGISADAEHALLARGPSRISAKGAAEGDLASDGPQQLQFEGIFAGRQTFFRVPQTIRAQYHVSQGTLTIAYKAGNAIQLGEAVPLVKIPVFRSINHVVVAPDRLLFFWGDNADGEPDRCYVPGTI